MDFKKIVSRLKFNPLKKSNNGVALLLAITSLMLMVYVASEVSKDSTIEYVVNSQDVNRIKAYYAARNSLDIALLRIKIFQQASQLQLPSGFANELDQLWKFPFAWPLPFASGASTIAKEDSEEVIKEALFDGQYEHGIGDEEGSKVDINDLASPSKTLRDVAKKQLLNIFEQKINSDETFRDKYQLEQFTELINRISDWMSPVNESENGGNKKSAFSSLGESYPPNRGFRTLDELRLIPGMTEEFFMMLSPQITIYGMKAINPNIASDLVLRSLDAVAEEPIKEALARRQNPDLGGPFRGNDSDACRNDFKSFIESRGSRLSADFDKIPFVCDKVINFKIQATGRSGSGKGAVQQKITAVVMDLNHAAFQIKTFVNTEKAALNPQQSQNPQTGPKSPNTPAAKKEPLPKGRPRIVYWSEN